MHNTHRAFPLMLCTKPCVLQNALNTTRTVDDKPAGSTLPVVVPSTQCEITLKKPEQKHTVHCAERSIPDALLLKKPLKLRYSRSVHDDALPAVVSLDAAKTPHGLLTPKPPQRKARTQTFDHTESPCYKHAVYIVGGASSLPLSPQKRRKTASSSCTFPSESSASTAFLVSFKTSPKQR